MEEIRAIGVRLDREASLQLDRPVEIGFSKKGEFTPQWQSAVREIPTFAFDSITRVGAASWSPRVLRGNCLNRYCGGSNTRSRLLRA